MKRTIFLLVLSVSALHPAWSAPRTVTLSIPGMSCAACPVTVKLALTQTPGVSRAEVNYEKRQALVYFDDAKTSTAALTQATANAGYSSSVLGATP